MRGNVSRSAALLDQVRPGWYRAIDLAVLDFEDDERCVLGQLFGHYDIALRDLSLSEDDPDALGFFGYEPYATVLEAHDLWAQAIGVRRFHEFRDQLTLFPAAAAVA